MAEAVAAKWSGVPDAPADPGRRRMLVVSATAAAAMLVAGNDALRRSLAPALTPDEIVRSFSKARRDWTVELAVLHHLDIDRTYALALLWAALELDLDPAAGWRRKRALRLYDLYAAASDTAGRRALAELVRSRSGDPALLSRAARWFDATGPRRPRLWRTTDRTGRLLGIHLNRA